MASSSIGKPALELAVGKLAIAGERAGFTLEQMIRILDAGFTVEDLLDLIEFQLQKQGVSMIGSAQFEAKC
jgi:hypothetical protein